jgi:hypothetical protein
MHESRSVTGRRDGPLVFTTHCFSEIPLTFLPLVETANGRISFKKEEKPVIDPLFKKITLNKIEQEKARRESTATKELINDSFERKFSHPYRECSEEEN